MKQICTAFFAMLLTASPRAAEAQQWTLRLDLRGRTVEGAPLEWSNSHVRLLGRDGYLWEFSPHEASNYAKASSSFRGLSASEVRGGLLRELSDGFEVSGAGSYVVAHPAGERDRWASRFDALHRTFVHYFTARGMRPRSPRFPLVAIAFRTQREFLAYARQTGDRVGGGVLGYYSPTTNRVLLYDVTAGRPDDENWSINAETIIHEAVHQVAFNTGIHGRFTEPPRWVVEGLGTMFEARGVWDARHYPGLAQRINGGQLNAFRRRSPSFRSGFLPELIASDRIFRSDSEAAYAQAWALSFFLAEQEPRNYGRYLTKTAALEDFTEYRGPERLRDFTQVFGENFTMLEARLKRFIDGLQ